MPRILTNKTNLPSPVYYAIKNDSYEARGDISVTTLIDSPYIRILKKHNQYEEDAADSIYSLLGQGVHHVVERVGKAHENVETSSKFFPEKKVELAIEIKEGLSLTLTGTTDLLEKKEDIYILHDFKNTSVFNAMRGMEGNKKWILQLNFYAAILKETAKLKGVDFQVNELYIHAFLRDWSRNKAEHQPDYPELQVQTFRIPVYSHESVMQRIKDKLTKHFEDERRWKLGEDIDVCTPEDRWQRPEVWRIVKQGAKRSLKNFEINSEQSKIDAQIYYSMKLGEHPTLTIDKVAGEDVRCVNYCPVAKFCKYYKAVYGQKEKGTNGSGEASSVEKCSGESQLQEIELEL